MRPSVGPGRPGLEGSHHLYVHVPFCRLLCAYCDFVTVAGRATEMPRYVDALLVEVAMRARQGRLETLYFGGGTPSLLAPADLGRLIDAAGDRWRSAPSEVTVEANPSRREAPDWLGLRSVGVNRISLGVQSLRASDLRSLARGHGPEEAVAAFRAARAAGFDNVSIDLVYGIPGQSLAGWRASVRSAITLAPDHVSLYGLQLTLVPDEWAAPPRAGAIRWRRRLAARQDDDLAAAHYELAEELLGAAGYRHYELSSWARPGRESRHNAAYWGRRPYTGIGAGAHSYDGTTRSWNERDLDRYLAAIERGDAATAGRELLDGATQAFEAVALGLRRVDGVERDAFRAEFGEDLLQRYPAAVEEATRSGLIEVDDDWMRLTPNGRLMANEALLGFLPAAR